MDFDDDRFTMCENAMRELASYGEFAQAVYDEVMMGRPIEEVQRRIAVLEATYARETLQALRAEAAFKRIGT
jgi:hypothetical protein